MMTDFDVSLADKSIFQALAQDKEGLMKLKKSVKDIQQSGTSKSSLISRYRHRHHQVLSSPRQYVSIVMS